MMKPSDEALRVANGIAQMYHPPLPDDLVRTAAVMIDDHTAALRAEAEALRVERDKNADAVTVWGWVWSNGGGMYPDSVELWDDGEYIAFDGKDWLHKAAEYCRAKQEKSKIEIATQ